MSPWARRGSHVVIVLPRGTELVEGIREAVRDAAFNLPLIDLSG